MPEWQEAIGRESVLWVDLGKHKQDQDLFALEITFGVFLCLHLGESLSADLQCTEKRSPPLNVCANSAVLLNHLFIYFHLFRAFLSH